MPLLRSQRPMERLKAAMHVCEGRKSVRSERNDEIREQRNIVEWRSHLVRLDAVVVAVDSTHLLVAVVVAVAVRYCYYCYILSTFEFVVVAAVAACSEWSCAWLIV